MRLSEQYNLLWESVSAPLRIRSVMRSKNGTTRHVPLNQGAVQALKALRKQHEGSEFVCGGAREPRRWFEAALKTQRSRALVGTASPIRLPAAL